MPNFVAKQRKSPPHSPPMPRRGRVGHTIDRCLVLYRHFVRITLFIGTTPPLKVQLSTCSDIAQQQPRSGGITQNIERGCVHASKKYYVLSELL